MQKYFVVKEPLGEEDLASVNLNSGNDTGLWGVYFDNLDNFGSFVAADTEELTSCCSQ